jgi:hypothetical protein
VRLLRKYASPATVRVRDGVDEPIPILPSFMMVKSEVDAELRKLVRRVVDAVSPPQTVSLVLRVEVPSAVLPDEVAFT